MEALASALLFFLILDSGFCSAVTEHPLYNSNYQDDEIIDLPGLPAVPSFRQYSGYLQTSGERLLHYWFTESQGSPRDDPVVLWLNGGPGCSSVNGMLTELGPFSVNPTGQTLKYNPYSWNKIANTLFIESPAGVGFSFALDGNYSTNDDLVALDNYHALLDFFDKFAHYKGKEFYITGESYAGIYIPTLLMWIKDDPRFNVKAAAIGNGYMKPNLLDSTTLAYYYYHGLIDKVLWDKLVGTCCVNVEESKCSFIPFKSKECQTNVGKAMFQIASIPIDPYNILGKCDSQPTEENKKMRTSVLLKFMLDEMIKPFDDPEVLNTFQTFSQKVAESIPCADNSGPVAYLNRPDVKQAIHVKSDLWEWGDCSSIVEKSYSRVYGDMTPQFKAILAKNISLLVYNGDLDTVCNFWGDELFVDSLQLQELEDRRPWFYQSEIDQTQQVGGFYHHFKGLSYLTVKGAGDMVPTDQPWPSFVMFQKFLSGNKY